jgi:hypothetical protein
VDVDATVRVERLPVVGGGDDVWRELGERLRPRGEIAEDVGERSIERPGTGDAGDVLGTGDSNLRIGEHRGTARHHRDAAVGRLGAELVDVAEEELTVTADIQATRRRFHRQGATDHETDRTVVELRRRVRGHRVVAEADVPAGGNRTDR